MSTVKTENEPITSRSYFHHSLLTANLHHTPYLASYNYLERNIKRQECCLFSFSICTVMLLVLVLDAVCVFFYISGDEMEQYADSFDIEGKCRITECSEHFFRGYSEGYDYKWIVIPLTFNVTCAHSLSNQIFDDGYHRYQSMKWNEGDTTTCHTNENCDDVFLTDADNKYYSDADFRRGLAIGFCVLIFFSLMGYMLWILRKFECIIIKDRKCISKMDIVTSEWCYYLRNKKLNKSDYLCDEWKQNMSNSQRFDYFISQYSKKYLSNYNCDHVYHIMYDYYAIDTQTENSQRIAEGDVLLDKV